MKRASILIVSTPLLVLGLALLTLEASKARDGELYLAWATSAELPEVSNAHVRLLVAYRKEAASSDSGDTSIFGVFLARGRISSVPKGAVMAPIARKWLAIHTRGAQHEGWHPRFASLTFWAIRNLTYEDAARAEWVLIESAVANQLFPFSLGDLSPSEIACSLIAGERPLPTDETSCRVLVLNAQQLTKEAAVGWSEPRFRVDHPCAVPNLQPAK